MNPVLGLAAFKPDLRRRLRELVLQVAEEPAVPLPNLCQHITFIPQAQSCVTDWQIVRMFSRITQKGQNKN